MAATIKKELGIEATLIRSAGGVFEVVADGKLLFSKKELRRFPQDSEILEALKSLT